MATALWAPPRPFKCVFEGFFRKPDNPVEKLYGIRARRYRRQTDDGDDKAVIATAAIIVRLDLP